MKQLAEAIIGISIGAILGIIFVVVIVVRAFGWLADLILLKIR